MASSIEQEIRDLQALHGSPRDPQGRAFVALADAYRRSGDPARGLDVVGQGVARHPRLAAGHLVAAWCLLDLGDAPGAEAAFRRVLELDEGNARALVGLGAVLDARGDADGATLVARGRALDPSLPGMTTAPAAPVPAVEDAAEDGSEAGMPAEGAPEDVPAEAVAPSPDEGVEEVPVEALAPSLDELSSIPSPPDEAPEAPVVGEIDDWTFVTLDEMDVEDETPDRLDGPVATADVIELVESFHASDEVDEGETAVDREGEGQAADGAEAEGEVMELSALAPDPAIEEFTVDDLDEGSDESASAAEAEEAEAFEIAALPDHPWTGQDADLDIEWEVESFYAGVAEGGEVPEAADEGPQAADEVPQAADEVTGSTGGEAPYEGGQPMDLADLAPDAEPVAWDEEAPPREEDLPEDEPVLSTRTLGELYARQGLLPEAVKVFADLVSRHPDDEALAGRLAELRGAMAGGSPTPEAAPASELRPLPAPDTGPTVSEFMAGLLGWERSGPGAD